MSDNNLFILRLNSDEEMKLRIVHGVKPNIYDATIDCICKNAEVSRRTFYNHFSSKYDINPWYKNFICKHTIAKIGEEYSWEEGFERLFLLMLEEKDCIMRNATYHFQAFPSSFDSVVERANWCKIRVDQLTAALQKRGIDCTDRRLNYCVNVYPIIESHAIRDWLVDPLAVSPKIATENLLACVPSLLYQALSDDVQA